MNETLSIVLTLLPFAVMLVGFLAFKQSALRMSLIVWILELVVAVAFYKMPVVDSLKASIWGNIALWTGFLVLWGGQVFGQCFRTTGALNVMLKALGGILPSKEGKALSLVSVVGGYVGAFNGFATYPVTIPGLVNLGVSGLRAAAGYLVYFSWCVSYVSLFIGNSIATAVTGVPVEEIVPTMGIITIPLIIVSTLGFFSILEFKLRDKNNLAIFTISCVGNILGVVIFTILLPELYIMTLLAAATFSLVGFWLLSKFGRKSAEDAEQKESISKSTVIKAFIPLVAVVVLVILNNYPLKSFVAATTFTISLWGEKTSVSLITAPGFYVVVAAIVCHLLPIKRTSSFWKDVSVASKRSVPSLVTLMLGGAMVQLMVNTGQINTLASAIAQWGASIYGVLLSGIGFLAGMAFGQGIPACSMFARMQMSAAEVLAISPGVLIGISTLITMGPANPLKPSLILNTSSMAGIKGKDGEMFGIMFKWQIVALIIAAVIAYIILL